MSALNLFVTFCRKHADTGTRDRSAGGEGLLKKVLFSRRAKHE